MSADYEVGYGKPPQHTRFRKGQSGNPRGRARHTKNLKTDLLEELQERILVREGTSERRLSKQRAMLKSLTMKAIKGDTRSTSILLNMVLRILDGNAESAAAEPPLTAEERAIIDHLEQRLRRPSYGRTDDQAGENPNIFEKDVSHVD
jgi:uncharacterized protein DUF5681